jgi:hypothetical protein
MRCRSQANSLDKLGLVGVSCPQRRCNKRSRLAVTQAERLLSQLGSARAAVATPLVASRLSSLWRMLLLILE